MIPISDMGIIRAGYGIVMKKNYGFSVVRILILLVNFLPCFELANYFSLLL